MNQHERCLEIYETQMADYRATAIAGEDRLRARIAALVVVIVTLKGMYSSACERIAAQSELLSRRAER